MCDILKLLKNKVILLDVIFSDLLLNDILWTFVHLN